LTNLDLFIHVALASTIIIICARLFGNVMIYIKQPRVVGEMIAGVVLGPTLLGTLMPDLSSYIFPTEIFPSLFVISNIGLSFYMFLVGAEVNLRIFNRQTARQSAILSVSAILVPFAAGFLAASLYGEILSDSSKISPAAFGVFIGTAFAITAFPMLARILQEKNIINTKIGSLSLMSAGIQDVASWVLLSFIIAHVVGRGLSSGFITLLGAMAFILFVFYVAKPLLRKLADKTEVTGFLDQSHFAIVVVSLLISALITDKLGLYSVFGGFILGLAMPRSQQFIQEIKTRLYDIMVVFLLPLFFAFSGLNTNIGHLFAPEFLVPSIVILSLAMASKYFPVLFSMRLSGFSWRESSAIGGLINARGLMELIIANIGLSYGLINKDAFSILVLVAVISTLGALPIYEASMNGRDKSISPEA
jgi:Kef-type K+ transport system membrane component KefB